LSESYSQSPRRTQLAEAGDSTLPTQSQSNKVLFVEYGTDANCNDPGATPPSTEDKSAAPNKINLKQPLPLLLQTFSGYHTRDNAHDFFFQVLPYFTPELVSSGETLWSQGEEAQGLYLIESGCLRATYQYEDHTELLQETMVAGTVAGELTALSGTRRNATVVVERDARLWKLSVESLERLQTEKPAVAREFVKLILKGK
jgi:SulP family sulfate permease